MAVKRCGVVYPVSPSASVICTVLLHGSGYIQHLGSAETKAHIVTMFLCGSHSNNCKLQLQFSALMPRILETKCRSHMHSIAVDCLPL